MPSPTETMQLALAQHRAGNLRDAQQLYLQVIQADPRNADAHHLLGMSLLSQGETTRSLEHFTQAVALQGQSAVFRHHLGAVLAMVGRADEAEAQLREAISQAPNVAAIYNDLGSVLRDRGQTAEAQAYFWRALELDANLVEAHNNLGNLLQAERQWEAALAAFETAARLKPGAVEVQFNLGNCYSELGRWDESIAAYRRAIALKPELAAAHRNLGAALFGRKDYPAAAASHRKALELEPRQVEALTGLGAAWQAMGRLADAKACYHQALAIKPDNPTALYNLGVVEVAESNHAQAERRFHAVLEQVPGCVEGYFRFGQCARHQGRFAEAVGWYRSALEANPDNADVHYHLGEVYLAQGELAAGWHEYQWRLKASYATRRCPRELPPGTNLRGARVSVVAEGGLGDTLQFVRYVPLLVERGAQVTLEAQPGLVPLLETSGFANVESAGSAAPRDVDWEIPMLSLPHAFATTLESIPGKVPYLAASEARIETWRERLRPYDGFKVGILWHGSKSVATDPRTIPLAAFERLSQIDGVRLFSLQQSDDDREIQAARERFTIVDFGDELDASGGTFMDTAAIMTLMDLVITSDTGPAHLAGGLGVPVWIALACFPDWRWLLDRGDSPWYPTARLFRQTQPGDWQGVFARMAESLQATVRASRIQRAW